MRKTTKEAITKILIEGPTSIKDISRRTGFALGTVTRALTDLGATSDGFYGAKWSITPLALSKFEKSRTLPGMPNTKVKNTDDGIIVSYGEIPLYKYNRSRHKLAEDLIAMEMKPTGDPKNYAKSLSTLAGQFASLAYALNESTDDPAWFTTLGGVEPATPEAA